MGPPGILVPRSPVSRRTSREGPLAAAGPIAVVCALEVERRALAALERPGVEIHVSGMGAEAAGAAGAAIARPGLGALIATGFCGALAPDLRVGELVAAERVVQEATGDDFPADARLIAAAPGRRGTLVSARGVSRTPSDRAALPPGLAVDLESAALARAARDAGVPFLALRAVSDRMDDRIPDVAPLLDRLGRADLRRLGWFVLRHPREIVPLIRLGRGARCAGRSLAEGIATLLARLGA